MNGGGWIATNFAGVMGMDLVDNDDGDVAVKLRTYDDGVASTTLFLSELGNVGIGTTTPTNPLEMASGAHVTAGGVWTDASSRTFKENIADISSEKALEALSQLNPVTFNYKSEQDETYAGFIAEDVPEITAMNDRKSLSPMDIVAVLKKVVKEQQKMVQEQQAKIEALEAKLK